MPPDPAAELHRAFGHAAFRPGQESIVHAVLAGRDVLAVMPTGSGKSIGYQLPAVMLSGLTLVVSPLISLMKDQVDELARKGIPAATINSQLTLHEVAKVMVAARAGALQLLYVAPERFGSARFGAMLDGLPVARFAVDEAHCVSEWGHDFRPDYRRLAAAADRCVPADRDARRPPIIAFTATATPEVRRDIVELLGLDDAAVFVTGFDRPNLFLDVVHVTGAIEKHERLPRLVGGRRGLVYASTRKVAERCAQTLRAADVEARAYHAGLPDAERSEVQDGFATGRISVVCATNAFGMGIDRPDIEVVVHADIPGSLEAYYQEIGRAGRDGRHADAILLWNYVDVRTRERLIDHDTDPDQAGTGSADGAASRERARRRELDRSKLQRMIAYADSTRCYRATILGYFGEVDVAERCEACGTCRRRVALDADQLILLRKVLSGVVRGGERWGRRRIAQMLRGDAEGLPPALANLSTTGLLADQTESTVTDWLEAALGAGLLRASDDRYRLLALTAVGREVLAGRRTDVSVTLPQRARATRRSSARRRRPGREGGAATTNTAHAPGPVDGTLLEALRHWRRRMAGARGVPAYVVLHDRTLAELASRKPASREALAEVTGIGPAKLESYGSRLLAIVAAADPVQEAASDVDEVVNADDHTGGHES